MLARLGRWTLVALVMAGCPKKETETPMPVPAPAPAPAADKLDFGPVIDAVNFDSGVVTVPAGEMAAVDRAAEILKSGDWKVIVVGLADAAGDDATNQTVSQQRAEAVAAELRQKVDLSSDRITVRGIGERLASGATQSERKVEFVFYKGGDGMQDRQIVMKSGALEEDFSQRRESR